METSSRIIAGIDIGSNASRLLIQEVYEPPSGDPVFNRLNFLRLPLRLGADTFDSGVISHKSTTKMLRAFKVYKNLMRFYQVEEYKAFATSAMRDASNGMKVVDRIRKKHGLKIEIIDGNREAGIISKYLIRDFLSDEYVLFIDVGGGSTELQFYVKGALRCLKSFNIGTVRMLNGSMDLGVWDAIKQFILENAPPKGKPLKCIGTGGNINKMLKISPYQRDKTIPFAYLKSLRQNLETFTYDERIYQMNFRSDRADVILPAVKIFLFILDQAGVGSVFVPRIGLVEGIVKSVYYE